MTTELKNITNLDNFNELFEKLEFLNNKDLTKNDDDFEPLSVKEKIDIIKLFEKIDLSEEKIKILLNKYAGKLSILISKMDFVNGSSWLSFFKGKIYGFTKFWKKNYIMKYPNYNFDVNLEE